MEFPARRDPTHRRTDRKTRSHRTQSRRATQRRGCTPKRWRSPAKRRRAHPPAVRPLPPGHQNQNAPATPMPNLTGHANAKPHPTQEKDQHEGWPFPTQNTKLQPNAPTAHPALLQTAKRNSQKLAAPALARESPFCPCAYSPPSTDALWHIPQTRIPGRVPGESS